MEALVSVSNLEEAPVIVIDEMTPDGRFIDTSGSNGPLTIYVWVYPSMRNVFWYTSSSFIAGNLNNGLSVMELSVIVIHDDGFSFRHAGDNQWHNQVDSDVNQEEIRQLCSGFMRVRSDYEAETALLELT